VALSIFSSLTFFLLLSHPALMADSCSWTATVLLYSLPVLAPAVFAATTSKRQDHRMIQLHNAVKFIKAGQSSCEMKATQRMSDMVQTANILKQFSIPFDMHTTAVATSQQPTPPRPHLKVQVACLRQYPKRAFYVAAVVRVLSAEATRLGTGIRHRHRQQWACWER